MKKLAVAMLSILATSHYAHAVRLGSAVSDANYKDYIVRFEVKSTDGLTYTCGGLLLKGQYVLTAGHCVGTEYSTTTTPDGYTTTEYQKWIDNGASNAITLYQSVDYYGNATTTTYSVIELVNDGYSKARTEAVDELDYVRSQYSSADWSTYATTSDLQSFVGVGHHDLALIKLNTVLSQKHSARLTPIYDTASNTFNVNLGDSLTFRGWGVDETDTYPSVMQQTTLALNYSTMEYNPLSPTNTGDMTACENSASDFCNYSLADYFKMYPTTLTSLPDKGDSGTPVVSSSDQVFSVAKSVNRPTYTYASFTNIGWYLPYIIDSIDSLSAPKKVTLNSAHKTTSFWIQNLRASSETINPTVGDNSANTFSISGCASVTLASMESCQVTLTYSGSTEGETARIYLADSLSTNISLSYSNPSSSTGGGEGEGGGGGAVGPWGMLLMMAFAFIRRRYA
ncbi:trypsin-like serine protease [Vibrio sp. Hal054]|uniref:trypsin-like serine protease n=1 Tax=Vibrio sp. Hal054 TaxID=3035158 RepID=UPI00301CD911